MNLVPVESTWYLVSLVYAIVCGCTACFVAAYDVLTGTWCLEFTNFEFNRGTTSRSSNCYAAVNKVVAPQLRVRTRPLHQTTQLLRRETRDNSSMIDIDGLRAPPRAGRCTHRPSYQAYQVPVHVVHTRQHHSYDGGTRDTSSMIDIDGVRSVAWWREYTCHDGPNYQSAMYRCRWTIYRWCYRVGVYMCCVPAIGVLIDAGSRYMQWSPRITVLRCRCTGPTRRNSETCKYLRILSNAQHKKRVQKNARESYFEK